MEPSEFQLNHFKLNRVNSKQFLIEVSDDRADELGMLSTSGRGLQNLVDKHPDIDNIARTPKALFFCIKLYKYLNKQKYRVDEINEKFNIYQFDVLTDDKNPLKVATIKVTHTDKKFTIILICNIGDCSVIVKRLQRYLVGPLPGEGGRRTHRKRTHRKMKSRRSRK